MADDLTKQIAALKILTVSELRQRHIQLFGEENRSGNRQYLFRRLAWRLQALAEGGLSERARHRAEELARDADVRQTRPRNLTIDAAPAGLPRVSGAAPNLRDQRLPGPGTQLKRTFKGRDHYVTVLTSGFEYDGQIYRSLSAIAHAITGSHWNGYHFFGLQKPERA